MEMRLSKRQITDPAKIHELIAACKTVRIATQDSNGLFIVPMSFGYDFAPEAGVELRLYLHSAQEGRKASAWSSPDGVDVAIEMDRELGVIAGDFACAYSYSYQSIMGSGHIHKVVDKDAKRAALLAIMRHMAPESADPALPDGWEFPEAALERVGIFVVDVYELSAKERMPKEGQRLL